MQNIIIPRPYQFVPPLRSLFWTHPLRVWLPRRVRRTYGVLWPEFRGLERIEESLRAGHGVLIAANHCRPCDPEVVGLLCIQLHQACWMMASWHLFMQGRLQRWLLRVGGVFSVYREGVDREALRVATALLAEARRPLVIFPEGIVSRSNDLLGHLMDGTAFIARAAAKQRARAEPPGKVVVHPVALHYYFEGDLRKTVEPVLTMIETRLGWQPQRDLKLVPRVLKLGEGLLAVREVEYFGRAQTGPLGERLSRLIDRVLSPWEREYHLDKPEAVTVERVKRLRSAIVPALVAGGLSPAEHERRWRQLADCYFAQQLACYPVDYLAGTPTVGRILETVERYEEDLTDTARVHQPLRVIIQIGEALEVGPDRPRGGEGDPLMKQLEQSLNTMLAGLASEERVWED